MRALLHSGGLDSHIIWLMDRKLVPVFIDHGQANVAHEKRALAALAIEHGNDAEPFKPAVLSMASMREITAADGHIPHRNLAFFICVAQAFTGQPLRRIAYGALRGEASPDKSPAFVLHATHALTQSEGRPLMIDAPLLGLTKPQAMRMVAQQHREWLPALALTRSCYSASPEPCGTCQACFRRALAYWYAGLAPTPPGLPTQSDGAVANLLRTPPARWWDLAMANSPMLRVLLRR